MPPFRPLSLPGRKVGLLSGRTSLCICPPVVCALDLPTAAGWDPSHDDLCPAPLWEPRPLPLLVYARLTQAPLPGGFWKRVLGK